MRRFLTTLIILAAIVIGVGLYRGWFTFTVHQDKLNSDEQKAAATLKHDAHKAKTAVDNAEDAPAK